MGKDNAVNKMENAGKVILLPCIFYCPHKITFYFEI